MSSTFVPMLCDANHNKLDKKLHDNNGSLLSTDCLSTESYGTSFTQRMLLIFWQYFAGTLISNSILFWTLIYH